MRKREYMKQRGFTLVELSIGLVIIGLIAGSIVLARTLIRVSELQSTVADTDKFIAAFNGFRNKYMGLPGDITNASAFWGGTVTNGNGNNLIDYNAGGPGEEYYAWQHLGLSQLIQGQYNGTQSSLPASKFKNTGYRIAYLTAYGKSRTLISLNGLPSGGGIADKPFLSSTDAYSLDLKVDDGQADKGKLMAFNEDGVPGCVTADYSASAASYIVPSDAIKCKLFFPVTH